MFIVIEGLDGAGKSTQVTKIREELKSRGIESEYIHFPRFDSPIFGEMIARFLRGEFGEIDNVNPYLVALLFAGDRANASDKIRKWLSEGKYVIADRYVNSNIAYQCAKFSDSKQKAELREWILNTEYREYNIVKPNLSIFLDVPFDFTVAKLTSQREGADRDYLNGGRDIHEESISLQESVREVYLMEAAQDSSIKIVDCGSMKGDMLSPDEIYKKISQLIFIAVKENRD